VVTKGQARVSSGSQKKTLSSGESITCPADGQVSIENTGAGELYLIQVELIEMLSSPGSNCFESKGMVNL
jgi:mannose-6-phosphate isomerase-like protein (cupin superfamily)